MQLATTIRGSQPDILTAIGIKVFQSVGATISFKNSADTSDSRETVKSRAIHMLTGMYREILHDLAELNETVSEKDGDELSKKKGVLISFHQLLHPLSEGMENFINEYSQSPINEHLSARQNGVLNAMKELRGVIMEILEVIDDILVAIDLLLDSELPEVLKKFYSGDFSGFPRHD